MGLFDKEDTISTIVYIDSNLQKKIVPICRIFDKFLWWEEWNDPRNMDCIIHQYLTFLNIPGSILIYNLLSQ